MPKRWFLNKIPDYSGGTVEIPKDEIKRRALDRVSIIKARQKLSSKKDCDGGIYVGVGGVAYMFWKLATLPSFVNERADLLENAQKYISPALSYAKTVESGGDLASKVGFLVGNTGVYATAALIAHAQGSKSQMDAMIQKYSDASKTFLPVNFLSCGGDELLVGRAGYLSGILSLRKALGVEVLPDDVVHQICNAAIISGREYAKRHKSLLPLMYSYYQTEYLGAAHGLSGILQMLLSFPKFLQGNPSAEKDVRMSVDFLLSLQLPNGNFPCALDEIGSHARSEDDELVHWCHGAPGCVFLMARAFLYWKDDRYLHSCIRCGELVWKRGLLLKGPGICHGVAGSGYVFLLLFRLTGDEKYLYRALQFADFMESEEFRRQARTPDSPYSLYEGLAGTVCFLSDLLNPMENHFPFFDIF